MTDPLVVFAGIGSGVAIIGVMVTGYGLKMTWNKNGKSHARDYGAVVQEVKDLKGAFNQSTDRTNKAREELVKKLDVVLSSQQQQEVHCAEISSSVLARMTAVEKETEKAQERSRITRRKQ